MFKRKKIPDERQYKIDNLGALIVERVQMPHSLTELDGSYYEITTWNLYLRVENGPILFERGYVMGDEAALDAMKWLVKSDTVVKNDMHATFEFYKELYRFMDGRA